MQRKQYTEDEKLGMVKAYLESGLTKYRFVMSHSEYKSSTLFKWPNKYSKQLEGTGTDTVTDNNSETSGKLDSVEKFNSVVDTAKMSKDEIGAYCEAMASIQQNWIYGSIQITRRSYSKRQSYRD